MGAGSKREGSVGERDTYVPERYLNSKFILIDGRRIMIIIDHHHSKSKTMRSVALLFLILTLPSDSARLTFSDGGNYTISTSYDETNIFVLNSTSLTLTQDTYTINAPASTDNGESAIRVENSQLYASGGIITGASQIGGSGVTITTDKDRDSTSFAVFEDGVEIVGGSAGRESTTRGGNAVQILQQGARVCYDHYFYVILLCL